jgi:hypothetical protein
MTIKIESFVQSAGDLKSAVQQACKRWIGRAWKLLRPTQVGQFFQEIAHNFQGIAHNIRTYFFSSPMVLEPSLIEGQGFDDFDRSSAQDFLTQLEQTYLEAHQRTTEYDLPLRLNLLRAELEDEEDGRGTVCSDTGLASLLLPIDEPSDEPSKAFFAPDPHFIRGNTLAPNPATVEGFDALKRTLAAAFASGKEFVAVRLCNDRHTAVAAFRPTGEFKIIDSLSNYTVNLKALRAKLNQAQLRDATGKKISFEGEYINTRLQKGGHECMRFATLYGYQMVKEQSFEGYQRVNGAFLEGRLKSFEDIAQIDGAPLVASGSKVRKEHYRPFMRSWAYRASGIKVDRWQDLCLADLKPAQSAVRSVYVLTSSHFIRSYPANLQVIIDAPTEPLLLPPNLEQCKLASLIPEGQGKVVIVADPDRDLLMFSLSAGQIIPRICH